MVNLTQLADIEFDLIIYVLNEGKKRFKAPYEIKLIDNVTEWFKMERAKDKIDLYQRLEQKKNEQLKTYKNEQAK
jgi:hypothetical protein